MSLALTLADPRPYQTDAIERMRREVRAGHRAVCLVLPTGGGKTVIAQHVIGSHLQRELARARAPHVLFVAHRAELIEQAAATFERCGLHGRVRRLIAGRASGSDAPLVTVASVQTLDSARWRDRLPDASMVVFDECHHVAAETWTAIAAQYERAMRIGLTATPERADGSSLKGVFSSIVVVASTRQLIELGYLVSCAVYGPTEKGVLAEDPVTAYERWGESKRAVMFTPTVAAAREFAARFAERGIPAAVVAGTMTENARKNALARFRASELRIVLNAMVLTEGWDDPGVEVCILARGCDHAGTYLQIVGRVLRPAPGKTRAILIDLRGAWLKHGLPDDEREFNLDGKAIKSTAAPCKQCPQCGYVGVPSDYSDAEDSDGNAGKACPQCGFVLIFKPRAAVPEIDHRGIALLNGEVATDLSGLTKAASIAAMRAYYKDRLAFARARGFKDGWAWHKYREQYPDGPAFRADRETGRDTEREGSPVGHAADVADHFAAGAASVAAASHADIDSMPAIDFFDAIAQQHGSAAE